MRPLMPGTALPLAAFASSAMPGQQPVPDADRNVLVGTSAKDILTLTDAQRPVAFRMLDKIIKSVDIPASKRPRALPQARRQIAPVIENNGTQLDVDAYMRENHTSGVLVLDHGAIALERYGLGRTSKDRWASFSVTKSVSSTLIGAALADGAIGSLDDGVVKYLPELNETPYEKVSVKNLIMMASGVDWNEDYTSPHNDLYSMITMPFIDMAKTRHRVNDPGTTFRYNTGDANLQTLIVERTTGKRAEDYLREKIWEPFGMADDAKWTLLEGHVTGGANIQMSLRDFGRFGLFFMEGGKAGGRQALPVNWTREATQWQLSTDTGDLGYGYTWWIDRDGSYRAVGIFGQTIYINPARQVVIVFNSAWPEAEWEAGYAGQAAFVAAALAAL